MYCIFYRPNSCLGNAVTTVIDSCPNTTVPSLKAVDLGSHFSIQWRVIYRVIIQIRLQIRTLMRKEARLSSGNSNNQVCYEQTQDICHSS